MLDDSFPTYRLQSVKEDPLQTTLFYTYNGSDPTRAYTLQRPAPSSSTNQYALALFDAHYHGVIYGEVLVKPEWPQPTLSAAEIRNQNGSPANVPITPDSFSVLLYNPDQSIVVKRNAGGWNRADSWGFEIPERTFKLPSASKLDQETGSNEVSDLSPKIMFHWKRDGRLNKDMTCYMSGKSVGGKKSKEPDITVAMYRSEKHGDAVCIYEPNMARVEVEDRKGLEVVLLLSAVVVRDLHFAPRQDPFNLSSTSTAPVGGVRRGSRPLAPSPSSDPTLVSGALADTPSPAQTHTPPGRPSPASNASKQAEIDAETRRLQAMVAEEERQRRERLAREEEEKTRRMLRQEEEEAAQRRWKQAEIDAETERLRREYGVQGQWPRQSSSPPLPQRPLATTTAAMSGALNGPRWHSPPVVNSIHTRFNLQPPPPPRPNSAGPGPNTTAQQQQQNGRNKLTPPSASGPYAGPSGARASALSFFGGGKTEEEKRKKMKKKQSVHF